MTIGIAEAVIFDNSLIRRAIASAIAHVERATTSGGTFQFADWSARIRIAAAGHADRLLRMIDHQRIDPTTPADWDIVVIEGAHAELEPLKPPPAHSDKRLLEINDDTYYFWKYESNGNLIVADRQTCRALIWYPFAGQIASWEYSRPFLYPIHCFMLPTAWTPVHAAAVGRNGAAILISGRGGTGKTTTALVCAEAGWDYLSDDIVLIGKSPWRARCLYRSARPRADMFEKLARSMQGLTNDSTDDGERRAEVDVGQTSRIELGNAAIRAIVLPRRTGAAEPVLVPVSAAQAMSALAGPTSIMLAGGHQDVFNKLSDLVATVPCYAFEPGPRIADIPSVLAPLVSNG